MVPTTRERSEGFVTKGVASGRDSAQSYKMEEFSVVRLTMPSRPPLAFIHFTWSSSMSSVATAGVL